jgi:hypothetical protein
VRWANHVTAARVVPMVDHVHVRNGARGPLLSRGSFGSVLARWSCLSWGALTARGPRLTLRPLLPRRSRLAVLSRLARGAGLPGRAILPCRAHGARRTRCTVLARGTVGPCVTRSSWRTRPSSCQYIFCINNSSTQIILCLYIC